MSDMGDNYTQEEWDEIFDGIIDEVINGHMGISNHERRRLDPNDYGERWLKLKMKLGDRLEEGFDYGACCWCAKVWNADKTNFAIMHDPMGYPSEVTLTQLTLVAGA